jgi:hypothetical protein
LSSSEAKKVKQETEKVSGMNGIANGVLRDFCKRREHRVLDRARGTVFSLRTLEQRLLET